MINEEPLRLAMKAIKEERETWNQASFTEGIVRNEVIAGIKVQSVVGCGTTMCLAGWVSHQAGWVAIVTPHAPRAPEGVNYEANFCVNPETGEICPIENVAVDILGITENQRYELFIQTADMDDYDEFRTRVEEITGVKIEA